MSCQPSPSKSATQTPGPNSSRLIEMPLFPLKCLNLIPAAAVTFANSTGTACEFCAFGFKTKIEQTPVNENASTRTKSTILGQDRGLRPLFECWDMVPLMVSACFLAAFYMY